MADPIVAKRDRWNALSFWWYGLYTRIILLYAPNEATERRNLWSELTPLLSFDAQS